MANGIVVLVEDNELVNDVLSSMLCDAGYRVVALTHARQALPAVPPDQPAVLVADVRLPGDLDGLALAEQWERDSRLRRAVVISGAAEAINTDRPVLQKPFGLATLVDLVAQKFSEIERAAGG